MRYITLFFAVWHLINVGAYADELGIQSSQSDFFDPDGYYFPSWKMVALNGNKLKYINLHTIEYYYDETLHYKKPRFVKPEANLTFMRLKDEKLLTYKCRKAIITRDRVQIQCPTPIGNVIIHGNFLDKRGQFWDRDDIKPKETILIDATIAIENGTKAKRSYPISFTYWSGD